MSFRRNKSKRGQPVVPGAKPTHRPDRPDVRYSGDVRRRRSVWSIPIANFAGAHHAVMPEALAEIGILASSSLGDTVLDPFAGSGTTLRVAERLGRDSIGIELNADYLKLQEKRTDGVQKMIPGLL